MQIDDSALLAFMQSTERSLGKLLEGQERITQYVGAVNAKADRHIADKDAHTSGTTLSRVAVVLSMAISVASLFLASAK